MLHLLLLCCCLLCIASLSDGQDSSIPSHPKLRRLETEPDTDEFIVVLYPLSSADNQTSLSSSSSSSLRSQGTPTLSSPLLDQVLLKTRQQQQQRTTSSETYAEIRYTFTTGFSAKLSSQALQDVLEHPSVHYVELVRILSLSLQYAFVVILY